AAYNNPCIGGLGSTPINGVGCWQNPIPDEVNNRVPLVGVNFTFVTQFTDNFGIPPRSVFIHPSSKALGIVGWKSPISGTVNIAGFFSDIDPNCDNGVIWSVDKENHTLTSGTIPNGGPPQTFNLVGV